MGKHVFAVMAKILHPIFLLCCFVPSRRKFCGTNNTMTSHLSLVGLNLARMLGDKFMKQQDSRFSSEPYISPVMHIDRGSAAFALMARYSCHSLPYPVLCIYTIFTNIVQNQESWCYSVFVNFLESVSLPMSSFLSWIFCETAVMASGMLLV